MPTDDREERLMLVIEQNSREATSILWHAARAIRETNQSAFRLLMETRDNLIDNPVDDEKTLWLYNRKKGTLPEMHAENRAFING